MNENPKSYSSNEPNLKAYYNRNRLTSEINSVNNPKTNISAFIDDWQTGFNTKEKLRIQNNQIMNIILDFVDCFPADILTENTRSLSSINKKFRKVIFDKKDQQNISIWEWNINTIPFHYGEELDSYHFYLLFKIAFNYAVDHWDNVVSVENVKHFIYYFQEQQNLSHIYFAIFSNDITNPTYNLIKHSLISIFARLHVKEDSNVINYALSRFLAVRYIEVSKNVLNFEHFTAEFPFAKEIPFNIDWISSIALSPIVVLTYVKMLGIDVKESNLSIIKNVLTDYIRNKMKIIYFPFPKIQGFTWYNGTIYINSRLFSERNNRNSPWYSTAILNTWWREFVYVIKYKWFSNLTYTNCNNNIKWNIHNTSGEGLLQLEYQQRGTFFDIILNESKIIEFDFYSAEIVLDVGTYQYDNYQKFQLNYEKRLREMRGENKYKEYDDKLNIQYKDEYKFKRKNDFEDKKVNEPNEDEISWMSKCKEFVSMNVTLVLLFGIIILMKPWL